MTETDIAVIGGGLAGLTAATVAARAGLRVTLFEQSQLLGGRARTNGANRFHLNLGPHALYRKGRAAQILRQLGVEIHGGVPSGDGHPDRASAGAALEQARPGAQGVYYLDGGWQSLVAGLRTAALAAGVG